MTHEQLVAGILLLRPGAEFNYAGDGSSLDPHTTADGTEAFGLQWPADAGDPPTYEDIEATLSEQAMVEIRAARNTLLTACDWTQTGDSPLDSATRAAWATYRQQLRDFPDQASFDALNPPAWPTPPA